MTLRKYLLLMTLASLVCWVVWALVVMRVDLEIAGWLGFLFFYLSLFLALIGTLFLLGVGIRKLFYRRVQLYGQINVSFRQSIFFAFLVTIVAFLQGQRLLTWWNLLLLIAGVTILEFFFISYRKTLS